MGVLDVKESVVLPLPKHIDVIRHAALLYTEQYQVAVHIQIRGQVMLHDSTICLIPNWVSIAQFDSELDLLGLGDPDMTVDDENLLWVASKLGQTTAKIWVKLRRISVKSGNGLLKLWRNRSPSRETVWNTGNTHSTLPLKWYWSKTGSRHKNQLRAGKL